MNLKRIASFCVAGLGVLLIGYGFYAKSHLSSAREEVHKLAASKNPVVKSVGKKVEGVIGNYTHKIQFCFVAGVVLVLAGVGGVYYFREHRKWW